MKKVLILEDDPLFAIKLEIMLNDSDFQIVSIFNNIPDAVDYLSLNPIDVLISDLIIDHKPLGKKFIEEISPANFPIIGITSSLDHSFYQEIKDHIMGFLVKPFHKNSLVALLESSCIIFEERKLHDFLSKKFLLLSGKGGKLERVNFTDIIYLESCVNYVTIISNLGKYAKKISLNKIQKYELNDNFIRIHHRYVVNTVFISNTNLKEVTLKNDTTLPVSRTFVNNLKDFIKAKEKYPM